MLPTWGVSRRLRKLWSAVGWKSPQPAQEPEGRATRHGLLAAAGILRQGGRGLLCSGWLSQSCRAPCPSELMTTGRRVCVEVRAASELPAVGSLSFSFPSP